MFRRVLAIGPRWFLRSLVTDCRVRFAPSPTGQMHLGSLRTALFNYLFARSNGGKFVLRIEDTDRERTICGAYKEYERILDYFGLHPDEGPSKIGEYGPYIQSQRESFYKQAINELLDRGAAYYCFCSHERLNMLRRNAARSNETFRYDNRCRSLSESDIKERLRNSEPHVVRFKLRQGITKFNDEVFGEIVQTVDEGDFVILKSDGFPTYHLANVVDDHLMKITHVIRGMEWISSVPKHIQLYNAFGWRLPIFAHLPLITRNGSKKLSKRDKDAFVNYYTDDKGYLPIAVLNFLIRNGSGIRNFDTSHLYSLKDMEDNFDLSLIGRRNFMMDETSLNHYGKLAFDNCEDTVLTAFIARFLRQNGPLEGIENVGNCYLQKLLGFARHRNEHFANISTFLTSTLGYLSKPPVEPEEIIRKFDTSLVINVLERLRKEAIWSGEVLRTVADTVNLQHSKMFLLLRLCLTGRTNGPPITDLIDFFGQNECFGRIDNVIKTLTKNMNKTSQ